jgi:hypothetical protein
MAMSAAFINLKIDRDEDGEETGVVGIQIVHQLDDDTSVEVELYHSSMYFEGYTFEQAIEAVEAAKALFEDEAISAPFTGDLSRHMAVGSKMPRIICGLFMLAGTDAANIGGMATRFDGYYLLRNGRILRCETRDKSSWWAAPRLVGYQAGMSKH